MELLLEKEVIFADDMEKIFGKRQWLSRSQEILAEQEKEMANASANADPATPEIKDTGNPT